MDYHYILLNVDKPLYRYDFHPNHPLILGTNPELGLKSIFLWYTYPNISEKYGNNKVKLTYNALTTEVSIPKGMYEISALSKFLNKKLSDEYNELNAMFGTQNEKRTLLHLGVNESTFKCYVKLIEGVQIDFSEGSLHKLLGLEPKVYDQSYEEGTGIINITRGVDRIFIRCNLVERNYQQEMQNVLFDILPFAQPGSAIQEKLEKIEYYRCKDSIIRMIELKVTDSKGNLIDLTEPLSIKICFKSQNNNKLQQRLN